VVDEQAGSGGYRDVSGRLKWIEGSIEGWKESRMLQKREKRRSKRPRTRNCEVRYCLS